MRTSLIVITLSFALLAVSAQAQAPSFTAASVVNAASLASGSIAPGMVTVITGSNLGDPFSFRNCSVTFPLPVICFGTTVLVNGQAAPIMNTSAGQITFQTPSTLSGSNATIQVTSNASGITLSSVTATVPVAPTAPALFTKPGSTGVGYYFVSGSLLTQYSPAVQVGDTVVMFGTGFGVTNPAVAAGSLGPNTAAAAVATSTLTIGTQAVPVTFAGLEPGNLSGATPGWNELIFKVPTGLTVPAGQLEAAYPVVVTVGGVASPAVNLRLATPPPSITSISPNPVPLSASPQTVLFNGAGFQSGANLTVHLVGPDGNITNLKSPDVTFVSSSQLSVQMTVGTTAGSWSVWIVNPDGGQARTFSFTASGSAVTPVITAILNATGEATTISQNTWVEIKGTNLASTTTDWSNETTFAQGLLPTTVAGVSATVNNKPAFIYYVSPTQVNILTPLDSALGAGVSVKLTNSLGTATSTTTMVPNSLGIFTFNFTAPFYPAAIHAVGTCATKYNNACLLAPPSLYPGLSTPAQPGETIVLFANGFGLVTPPLINGGLPPVTELPTLPVITIGGVQAHVDFAAIVAAGEYQFNVVVPAAVPDGDNLLAVTYNGVSTQGNVFLTVKK